MDASAQFELCDSPADRDAAFALFESTGWNREYALTPIELEEAMRRSWRVVTVYDGGALVGTGRVISDGVFHALIVDVIVRADYRGRGLGTAIMNRLVEECRAARIRDVQLFCARGKVPFYTRLGFTARAADAPGMDLTADSA